MPTPTHRPYQRADRDRLRAFLTEASLVAGPLAGYYHGGDLIWKLSQHPETNPEGTIQLWEDETGQLIGLVLLDPPDLVDLQLHPHLLDLTPVVAEMATWAEGALTKRAVEKGETPPSAIQFDIATTDGALATALANVGCRDTGADAFVVLAREVLDLVDLPTTTTVVRDMTDPSDADLDRRVALHREVWHPSRHTAAGYRHMRTQPVYRPDLDLVALAPDGDFAAYCIAWLDPETRVGNFEPVGASPRHRRQGHAAAAMAEALRCLHTLGATRATVGTFTDNTAALALYRSLGFTDAVRYRLWERTGRESGVGSRE